MSLITHDARVLDEYEAVVLPRTDDPAANRTDGRSEDRTEDGADDIAADSAVLLRRSARPSRRAVLHLGEQGGSRAHTDLARWYNERGFHFYLAELDLREALAAASRRRSARSLRPCFDTLDRACTYLRDCEGIDAIILSAEGAAAAAAALWCDAGRAGRPVDVLIMENPDFNRAPRAGLSIGFPVLVISMGEPVADSARKERRDRRGQDALILGKHVTWLHLDGRPNDAQKGGTNGGTNGGPDGGPDATRAKSTASAADDSIATQENQRRLFDEMGRWLGAYMYGQVRDQLL